MVLSFVLDLGFKEVFEGRAGIRFNCFGSEVGKDVFRRRKGSSMICE